MKTIKFAQDFKKLNQPVVTTIRFPYNKKWQRGQQVEVIHPGGKFIGTITNRVKIRFDNIPHDFLMEDCEVETPEDAFKLLKKFYPKMGMTSKVIVLWIQNDKLVQQVNEQEVAPQKGA